jgi:hypothetical protein
MTAIDSLSIIRLRRATHQAINSEARMLGLKQWAMIDQIVEVYFTNKMENFKD